MSRYAPEGVEKEVISDRPGICEELCCLPGGCRQCVCVCVLTSVLLQPSKEDSFKVAVGQFQGHCAFKGTFCPSLYVPLPGRA